jgi:hypothetical protein
MRSTTITVALILLISIQLATAATIAAPATKTNTRHAISRWNAKTLSFQRVTVELPSLEETPKAYQKFAFRASRVYKRLWYARVKSVKFSKVFSTNVPKKVDALRTKYTNWVL